MQQDIQTNNIETKFLCSHDRPMSLLSLVKLRLRIPENRWAELTHSLNYTALSAPHNCNKTKIKQVGGNGLC